MQFRLSIRTGNPDTVHGLLHEGYFVNERVVLFRTGVSRQVIVRPLEDDTLVF